MERLAPERGGGGSRTVSAAILANVAVATAKFVAAAFTGSSAILSEAIHSVVDTGDGILLSVGRRRSARPPDRAARDPAVARVGRLITVHFGPRTVVLNAELQFHPDLRAGELAEAVARIERRLKERHPELKYLFLEGTCLSASG